MHDFIFTHLATLATGVHGERREAGPGGVQEGHREELRSRHRLAGELRTNCLKLNPTYFIRFEFFQGLPEE